MPGFQLLLIFLVVCNRMFLARAFLKSFITQQKRQYRSTSIVQLNRFLFDPSEVESNDNSASDTATTPRVILPKDDYRTVHAAKILGLANGDTIRAGIVSSDEHNGLWTDDATIEWIPEGKVKKAEVLKNGNPPGSLAVHLDNLSAPNATTDEICVSLILALPRPLALGRMLPMISQMGVDHLVLTRARKVPKEYFGSHLFRKPEALRERLVEGLCQAGDVRLPKLHVVKNLPYFLEDDLDALFPTDEYARVIAHPQRSTDSEPLRMSDIQFPETASSPKAVIAVGPEGGWEEPSELELFQSLGFQQITLGTRTLRSDCAVVSLLSLANEVCQKER